MKLAVQKILYIWSAIMLLSGLVSWLSTFDDTQSALLNPQTAIQNALGLLCVWLAIFTFWYSLDSTPLPSDEQEKEQALLEQDKSTGMLIAFALLLVAVLKAMTS